MGGNEGLQSGGRAVRQLFKNDISIIMGILLGYLEKVLFICRDKQKR
jgi:hypothetical protein